MKILVIGATGFIGSHLVPALVKKGYKVRCLVRKTSDISNLKRLKNVEFFYGDITDPNSLKDAAQCIDVVFHLAAKLGDWGIKESTIHKVNVLGTKNLLDSCIRGGARQLVFSSTPGVIGLGKKDGKETDPYNPRGPYEKTKAQAEETLLKTSVRERVKITILRPDFVYGPGDQRRLSLFKAISKRRFLLIGNGKAIIHPTFIEDVIQGFLLVINNKAAYGQIFNIAGPQKISVEEFVSTSASLLNTKLLPIKAPKTIALFAALINEAGAKMFGVKPLITRSRIEFLTTDHSSNIDKARRLLGYNPKFTPEKGLNETINWYKSQRLLLR